jgi:hypothetical protein
MNSGAAIGQVKVVNGQAVYGTDILTRITFAMENPGNAELLPKAMVKTFDSLLEHLTENTGIDAHKCPVMIFSGNTTMIHFLLRSVFASSYAPVVSAPGFIWGRELVIGKKEQDDGGHRCCRTCIGRIYQPNWNGSRGHLPRFSGTDAGRKIHTAYGHIPLSQHTKTIQSFAIVKRHIIRAMRAVRTL